MSPTEQNTDKSATPSALTTELEQLLKELLSLGRLWAGYGLTVGKQALETAAQTQTVTARCLGELADKLTSEEQRHSDLRPQP